jgi:pimeloyl-ACP methyl ester carboxylesterase
MVHSAGGPFGYLVANERPQLVKGIVNVEGGGAPFSGATPWGLTDIPLAYDPPVTDPAQLKDGTPRVLKNLRGIPIGLRDGGTIRDERRGRPLRHS